MSLSTMAAARQNEMNASLAVVATSTRGAPDVLLCWDEVAESLFIRKPRRIAQSSAFRSRIRSRFDGRFYTSPMNPGQHTAASQSQTLISLRSPEDEIRIW